MNRIFIRMFGYILGVMGWLSTVQSAVSETIGGTVYVDKTNYITVTGFASYTNYTLIEKYCPSGHPATGGQSCTQTGGTGEPPVCVDLPDFPTECGGDYFCNTTGLYCSNTGFFVNHGVSYTGAYWNFAPDGYKYQFSGCDTAYYQSSTGGYCNDTTTVSNVNSLSGCCTICPMYSWSNNSGITFPNTGNLECLSGWCVAASGAGITACRAYQQTITSFTDSAGTYIFESTGYWNGCPYEN